ncbi:MAG: hypothetical protein WBV39_07255 [Rudaea sp.]
MSQRNNASSTTPMNQQTLVGRCAAAVLDTRAITVLVLVLVLLITNGGAG